MHVSKRRTRNNVPSWSIRRLPLAAAVAMGMCAPHAWA